MASILNEAVYLLNPAGSTIAYKEDSLYSVLPNDGTGDYTWIGGQGGTRVNQDGYIERTPFNQFKYSNDLNTSPWSMNVTGGQTDKDGGNDAWLLTKSTATTSDLYNDLTIDGIQTFSIYVKKESSKGIKIYNFGDATQFVSINIETGANYQQSGAGIISYQAVAYNSDWWRVQVTMDCTNGKWYIYVTNGTSTQIADSITIQDAQLNAGDDVRPYQPTLDRLDYPRIDFSKGKGALLLEKQATNHVLYSEDLTDSEWSKNAISITIPGDVMSPDGTLNANKVTRGGTSSTYFWQENTRTTSDRFNSLFFKAGTTNQVTCLGNSYNSGTYATFDLSTGTVVNSTGCAPFIIKYKNGWYRCGIKQTNGVSYPSLWTLNGYTNETVVSGEYIYAWGGQSERVANNTRELPSSYIPTQAASVTRLADDGYTEDTSNLPTGNSPRTLFTEFEYDGVEDTGDLNGTYNWISGYGQALAQKLFSYIVTSTDTPYFFGFSADNNFTGTTLEKNKRYRWAATYNGTTVNFFINGSSIGTYNPPTLNTTDRTLYQNQRPDGNFNSQKLIFTEAVFPRQLSTAEAQTLTSFRSGSGGEITNYGPYTIHTFTGSATFTPSFTGEVEVLVVAGGGGGESHNAGGGGAGGVIYLSSAGVSTGTGYTITVGAGGLGSLDNGGTVSVQATNGSNSSAFGLEAIGGGAGGTWDGTTTGRVGSDGGSGGGGGASTTTSQPGGSGISGQGNNGGNGSTDAQGRSGGGGGGAGEAGGNAVASNQAGDGGDGLPYSISGFSKYYGGGGGGAPRSSTNPANYGDGGLGGGGSYRLGSMNLITGVDGTGGGGSGIEGASLDHPRPNGGSGIVIVRYLT